MLNEILNIEFDGGLYNQKPLAHYIQCVNGVSLSVQASRSHYCRPRKNYGPYTHVEVGFPTIEPPGTWAEYMDADWETRSRTDTVYGYIPIELVEDFINENGGISG